MVLLSFAGIPSTLHEHTLCNHSSPTGQRSNPSTRILKMSSLTSRLKYLVERLDASTRLDKVECKVHLFVSILHSDCSGRISEILDLCACDLRFGAFRFLTRT
jgi:hypothetical protein